MDTLTTIRPELLSLNSKQMEALWPFVAVFAGTIVTMLISVAKKFSPKWPVFLFALLTCLVGMGASVGMIEKSSLIFMNGMWISDGYSHFFNILFLASAALTVISSVGYLDREKIQHPEYYILVLFASLGMMCMTASLDLISLFISLELMSLPIYVLVGFRRNDRRCNEASMKYFILGSAASALLLYGSALLYGCTGSTSIQAIVQAVQQNSRAINPLFMLGAGLVCFGFLFKIAIVPFHMWMPDVYEGAPVPVTGFMTTGLKAAAFGAFLRVFLTVGYSKGISPDFERYFHDALWVSAVLTMVVGNLIALTQTNLKRLLAYSSIAHSGYLLLSILVAPHSDTATASGVQYIFAYAIMNMGAFLVLTLLSNQEDRGLRLQDIAGLGSRHPLLAFSLTIFLFSMAGIPPTAGFVSKYLLFYSAIQANEVILVVIGVLCSAVSVYYYLRILVYMYMRDPIEQKGEENTSPSTWAVLAVVGMMILTFYLGLIPSPMMQLTKSVVAGL